MPDSTRPKDSKGAESPDSASGHDTEATTGAPAPGATATHHPGGAVPADLVNHPRYEVLQLLG